MFTNSVLRGIKDPDLRKKLHLDDDGQDTESTLNWLRSDVKEFEPDEESGGNDDVGNEDNSLQQSDLLRRFYLSIARRGLKWTYNHSKHILTPDDLPHITDLSPFVNYHNIIKGRRPVIIVGAGISGLVAGYELKKAGYEVVILEMSQRFGGRVKTLGQAEGFDRGLHTDGKHLSHTLH